MITNDLNHIILQKKFLSLSLSLYLSFGWSGQVRSLIGNKPTYSHRHHHCHGHHLGCLYSNNWDFCTKGDWANGRKSTTMLHKSHCIALHCNALPCISQSTTVLHNSHCIALLCFAFQKAVAGAPQCYTTHSALLDSKQLALLYIALHCNGKPQCYTTHIALHCFALHFKKL